MNTFWPELKAVSRIRVSQVCIQFRELGGIVVIAQGSHASWKVLVFFFKIPGPGKSWKITLVLESPGKISLENAHDHE